MSSESAASDVISVPQGGGAISGMGETFAPDLYTGTGNFTVPITLPEGRNGFGPKLSLVYSTGHGNGPFGLGWTLSIPGVSRKTERGVPRYDDGTDTFVLSGFEDLVPVANLESVTRYRPRTEGGFARIDHHRSPESDFWEVRGKDGLRSFYGVPPREGGVTPVIADPQNSARIFAWKLAETMDTFGNRIVYRYARAGEPDSAGDDTQTYLERIEYVNFDDTSSGAERFLVSVRFIYEGRPDPFSGYRSGFEIRQTRRCRRIQVQTHVDRDAPHLVHAYDLVYLDERVAAGDLPASSLPPNDVSLLSQIVLRGRNGAETERMPPLELGYSRFSPEKRHFAPLQGHIPGESLANSNLDLADLTGDGLPDILQLGQKARYWRNLGDGRFDVPREMRDAPAGVTLADPGVRLLDADGDGRIDLLATGRGTGGYFPLRHDGEWDRQSFRRYKLAPSVNLQSPQTALTDMDGDGATDLAREGDRFECFFGDGHEGWSRARRVPRRRGGEENPSRSSFPDVSFADPRVRWADMTGDGLRDIVLVHDGNVEYWPNLGHGNWGRRIHLRNSPRFPRGYNPRRILLGDVDGDGAADLIYVDHCKTTLWINRSGNRWSEPYEIDGTPPLSDRDDVRLSDIYGSGTQGVLWSKADIGDGRPRLFFLDFTGKAKPYLLDSMDNHRGAVTRVGYISSSACALADRRDRRAWRTTLPFPVQVVSRVEIIDQLSGGKLTTEYRYHHGYWDGFEREFRGFGMVEQLDTESFETYRSAGLHGDEQGFTPVSAESFSPPTLTKTWFHQGAVGQVEGDWEEVDWSDEYWPGDPPAFRQREQLNAFLRRLPDRQSRRDALRSLRGSVLRIESYALDGSERTDRPYTVTEKSYGTRQEDPPETAGATRPRIFFPHHLAERVTQWERGEDPMTRFNFSGTYDEYGQPLSSISIAVPRGRDYREPAAHGEPYLATISTVDYAKKDTEDVFVVDRVARSSAYEIPNDGGLNVFDFRKAIEEGTAPRKLIGQTLNFYDGSGFTGLAMGGIDQQGALMRSETLVLTDELLQDAYPRSDPTLTAAEAPYFVPQNGQLSWPDEYPAAFAASQAANAPTDATRPGLGITPLGYGSSGPDPDDGLVAGGYYIASRRLKYNARGLLTARRALMHRRPGEHDLRIEYDAFGLLPVQVTDPVGLETKIDHDYRVLQARRITDANGNLREFFFSPLGLVREIFVRGKSGEGDINRASSRFDYDLLAFEKSTATDRQPVWVRALRRENHDGDDNAGDAVIATVEYTDGFGRLLQTRTQSDDAVWGDDELFGNGVLHRDPPNAVDATGAVTARRRGGDDPPNVVVSGWITYDNKGRAVERYEPFFAAGWDYLSRAEASSMLDSGGANLFGRKVKQFHDPRGQVVRVINPDGSEQRVIYGVPADLAEPDVFEPTPWEAYTYDANDNAGRSHSQESTSYAHHWNTPASVELDALGRVVAAIERTREGDPAGPIREIATRSRYDIRGNLLTVTDALDRDAFRYVHDLADRIIRTEGIDAGAGRIVVDAAGGEVERRDSKQALVLQEFDRLRRPTRVWARDGGTGEVTLRQRFVYGDDGDRASARARNGLGRLHQQYDEAGKLVFEEYDFKGNTRARTRFVVRDERVADAFTRAAVNDWQAGEDALLEADAFSTSTAYDALNRPVLIVYPPDIDGHRATLRPGYNRGGGLERVTLDGDEFVKRIAYNAKGQRTFVAYGNGLWTRYAYDTVTFRLARLHTGKFRRPDEFTYQPAGGVLQDLEYSHDLVGNTVAIHDRSPGSGVGGADELKRTFGYDPVYRLTLATGREHHGTQHPVPPPPWQDAPVSQNAAQTRSYTRTFAYDAASNLERVEHRAGPQGGFVRRFTVEGARNRLRSLEVGQVRYAYEFDPNGNLVREGESRHFAWNHVDQLRSFRVQAGGANPSTEAHYLYDAAGQRVKKLVRKGGNVEATIYVDGIFEHHRWRSGSVESANNLIHIMDDESRIALVRRGPPRSNDTAPAVQYHIGDHIGSSHLVVGEDGRWMNREEYFPYGGTSYGSFSRKRYRYTAMERDEESGLSYHGARYYAPYLCRWTSCDPLLPHDGTSSYEYSASQPLRFVDSDGMQATKPKTGQKTPEAAGVFAKPNQPTAEQGERIKRLEDNLIIDTEDLADTATDMFNDLHAGWDRYLGKLTDWTTPFSAEEVHRTPTREEQLRTAELVQKFTKQAIYETVLSGEGEDVSDEGLEGMILNHAFLLAKDARQEKSIEDTPSLVAAEHYLTARGLMRTSTDWRIVDRSTSTINMLAMLIVGIPAQAASKNVPFLSRHVNEKLQFSDKPRSPPWVWARAWKYLGAMHSVVPGKVLRKDISLSD